MSNFCYCTSRSRWQWCELSNFLAHPGLWSLLLGQDLGCIPQTKHTQMVFLLIKGVITAVKSSSVSIHCSPEPSVSLSALLFFFPLQYSKESSQTKQTQACLQGSAISSCFMLTEGAGERVLLMAKVILGGLSPLFLPSLRLPSDVLWFGGEKL